VQVATLDYLDLISDFPNPLTIWIFYNRILPASILKKWYEVTRIRDPQERLMAVWYFVNLITLEAGAFNN
jgi:hypothetical protein